MKNPKEFAPTPHDYMKPIDHSGPSGELKHNGTRKEIMTSPTHFKPVKHSGDNMGLGDLGSEKKNRADHMKATAHDHFQPTPHSDPTMPVEPKSWKKSGYSKGMDE